MTKDQIKQFIKANYFKIIFGIIFVVLASIEAYQFGWKKIEANIYQKGVADTKISVIRDFTNQYIQGGKIQIPIMVNAAGQPDIAGTTTAQGTFILKTQ